MVLFVLYALSTIVVLWSTLFYLPYGTTTQHFGFVLNILLLGLLSLLSFLAYRQELHFRSIFYHFWILFAALALASPIYSHASYWGGDFWNLTSYVFLQVIVHALFLWVSAKTVFAYIFRDERRWAINVLSTLVVVPICAWLFWPFWWSPEQLMNLPGWSEPTTRFMPLYHGCYEVDIATLLLLVAFFWHKLKTDRPLGAYADTILFFFGAYVLIDFVDIQCQITSIEMSNITLMVSGVILIVMSITLVLRLKYKSQSIAQYYESQLLSNDSRVDRRVGWFDRLILRSFFDPEKVGESIYLGEGRSKMKIKRSSYRVNRTQSSE